MRARLPVAPTHHALNLPHILRHHSCSIYLSSPLVQEMMLENGVQEHACKLLNEMPLLVTAKGVLELLL